MEGKPLTDKLTYLLAAPRSYPSCILYDYHGYETIIRRLKIVGNFIVLG